jgi:hypothetical protein
VNAARRTFELSDVDPDEVSPVARGANLKRFALLKEAGGTMQLSKELEDAVSVAHPNEGAMVDALRKGGVSETAQDAAVLMARLSKAFEDELPEAMEANVDAVVKGLPAKPPPVPAKLVQKAAPAGNIDFAELLRLASVARGSGSVEGEDAWSKIEKAAAAIVEKSTVGLSRAQAVTLVLKQRPELYTAYIDERDGRRGMPAKVEKAAGALAKIEQAAQREMARDRTLSHAQAVARSLSRDPRLYSDYLAEANGDGQPDDDAAEDDRPTATGSTAARSPLGDAWSKIEKAAAAIVEKSGDTPLSEAQAVARVLREQPALYSDYLAEANS